MPAASSSFSRNICRPGVIASELLVWMLSISIAVHGLRDGYINSKGESTPAN